MAEKNNATCSICGKGYHVCRSCGDSIQLHPWKNHCCSASHYQVFQAVRGLSTGVYSKEEFESKLKNIDLSDLESYREHIKDIIINALKKNETVVENPVDSTKTDEVVAEKPVYFRKRNYKIEAE